jgi:cytochrome c553
MSDLVQRLDERDIAAVAAYYQRRRSAVLGSAGRMGQCLGRTQSGRRF